MVLFVFRIYEKDGTTFEYSFRAKDKLAAYAHMMDKFPDKRYKKILP